MNLDGLDAFRVKLHGPPFRVPTWATPILAGQYPDGQRTFIAVAYYKGDWRSSCDVAEGTHLEDMLVYNKDGKPVVPDSIELLVLRYAPHAYPGLVLVGPNGERTTGMTGDLSGYAAEVTYINDSLTHYRSDSQATSAHITEL